MPIMIWFVAGAILLRLATWAISIRNEARLKRNGAREFGALNSSLLAIAHIAFYVSAAAEGLSNPVPWDAQTYLGFGLYGFGIVMLLTVIRLLGPWWTVKIIIAPDHVLVRHPLFRYVRHPNYFLNMLPELTGFALALHAPVTLFFGLPCYLVLMTIRIWQENRAMTAKFPDYAAL